MMDNQLVWRLSNASLSAQSAPSPSLITLPYPPYQPHLPHSSPSPICLISPITLTPHPPLSAQSAPSASLITLPYLPNQPPHPYSSPSPIPKVSKGFSKTYPFVVFSSYSSLHKPSPLVGWKNAQNDNYRVISYLQMIIFYITSRTPLPF